MTAGLDDDKRTAALAAVAEVESGMLVGLGTGSTAAHAIAALGERVRQGLAIRAVATSQASWRQAEALGIALLDFADVPTVDLTIDGADEIDDRLRAIKGAGGAMLREKVVAAASTRMVVIADGSKRVAQLGSGAPVPVEVLPFARTFVARRLAELGATACVRGAPEAPARTDGGNIILDARFPTIADAAGLADALATIPGALGHGLFLDEVDAAYIAENGNVTRLEREDRRG